MTNNIPERLSRIRSEAGRKGAAAAKARGNHKGGRRKGEPVGEISIKELPKTISVREPDYNILVRLAHAQGTTIISFMHLLAQSLKAKNPSLFQ